MASIIAKVISDRDMLVLDTQYLKYGFAKNKEYSTIFHLKQLKLYGPILEYHRKSFSDKEYDLNFSNIFY